MSKEKRNTIIKWCLLVLLVGYSSFMVVWGHQEAARHVCNDIEIRVSGNPQMDSIVRSGVLQELAAYPEPIKGVPLDRINTRKIERYLSRLGTFETVHCALSSSGALLVKVTPLVPVMRVFFGDNSYYINRDGKHIASNAEFYSDVPVVTGNFNRNFQPVKVLPLVNFINSDPAMRELTNMIEARDAHNLIVVPRIYGHVINFGDTTRLAEKAAALKLFYREVMPYKGWQEYDTISVKYRGQIVATRRDKTHVNHGEVDYDEIDLEESTLPDAEATAPGARPDTTTNKPVNNKPEHTTV